MRAKFLKLLNSIRSSYWFVPAVMAVLALILGSVAVYVDVTLGSDWLDDLSWYQDNKPDGAQEVLSTIAGSAITVAGVVFSITIVAVAYAASQYGPRVLTNFMMDRGNQITLGTFIATFLYCIVVLRTIRGGDDNDFVPDLAVIIALVLALCSIAVLIYFINHIPRSIHANAVIAGIGCELIESLDERYPEFIGEAAAGQGSTFRRSEHGPFRSPQPLRSQDARPIPSRATGYIEAVDEGALMEIACQSAIVIQLERQPGDYIHAGRTFALAWPAANLDPERLRKLQESFAVSNRRTPFQDSRFLIDELVEVGARALSPSVNDPYTAVSCLDWIGSALTELARRRTPTALRYDPDGNLRVVAKPTSYSDYVRRSLGRFRQYLATDRNASVHALRTIATVGSDCRAARQIEPLLTEARALREAAAETLTASLFRSVAEAADEAIRELERLKTRLPSSEDQCENPNDHEQADQEDDADGTA